MAISKAISFFMLFRSPNLHKWKDVGGIAQFGKSGLRRKFSSERGTKTQESFVDFKFLQRSYGVNFPQGTEALIVRCCLKFPPWQHAADVAQRFFLLDGEAIITGGL
ncbi:MAG: hypothetical protein LUG58_03785 [Clostridiales bacterium]|nr:hypothetical protein [Clostridiales bacterium]